MGIADGWLWNKIIEKAVPWNRTTHQIVYRQNPAQRSTVKQQQDLSTTTTQRVGPDAHAAIIAAREVGAIATVHQIATRYGSPICALCLTDVHPNQLQLGLMQAEADGWGRGAILCKRCLADFDEDVERRSWAFVREDTSHLGEATGR